MSRDHFWGHQRGGFCIGPTGLVKDCKLYSIANVAETSNGACYFPSEVDF